MSAYLANFMPWEDQNGIVGQCFADTITDLPAVNAFSPLGNLVVSSTCRVIDTGKLYQLDGAGTWHEKQEGVTLDLTGYYTSAQTDSAINTALSGYYTDAQTNAAIAAAIAGYYSPAVSPASISNGTDIFTLPAGVYAKATSVNTLVNLPSDFTGNYDAFLLFVRLSFTGNNWRRQFILFPVSNSGAWETRLCYRNNETSTAGTFGNWVRFDGGTVL